MVLKCSLNGDFNYDGFISADDYSAIDFNLVAQGAAFPTNAAATAEGIGAVVVVPEPSAGAAIGVILGAALRRRRRIHGR